ncbi:MAG: DegV family protein [Oscillospiraceae bacterium]|nr:DegV family protein [Oscillospiraceae bacterium]
MMKTAIVTDTNSGFTQEEADKLGIYLVPMPFIVDGTEYFEGVSCTYEHFFEMLAAGGEVSTTQPSPDAITSLWDKLLESYDNVIHMPMSSALSSSYATATALAAEYNGRVLVPDNKRISVTLRQAVLDAAALSEKGETAEEILRILEETALDSSIYLAVNTLELLKKSGRVTAAGATVAAILGIKPVLQIQGEKLDAFAKARGMDNAKKVILEALKKDRETRFKGKNAYIAAAYSGDYEPAEKWLMQLREYFGDDSIQIHKLPVSISCHVGAGVMAAAVICKSE